ncbi:MAG: DUF1549 domain-containing protein [Verrucomicrobiales bacterium]|nr:DUF1549 domain-containing protein [Verrucomicrobiales bacterium]
MKTATWLMTGALALGVGFQTARLQAAAALPEARRIDEILARHWEKEKLAPQPLAPDEVFLRRVYLDVIGRVPTLEEARAFLTSADPTKRAKLIDQLLASPGYASHTFNYLADVLRLLSDAKDSKTGQAYADWLKTALAENRPYDQMVRELLTTEGGAWDSGAIGFYMRDRGMPLDHLAATVQVFLGTRIECAQCHNHPFDKWTQMDYYKMAGFTYGMDTRAYGLTANKSVKKGQRKKMAGEDRELLQEVRQNMQEVMKPLRYTSIHSTERLPHLPDDYKYDDAKPKEEVAPATMFGHEVVPGPGESRLAAFSRWMTSPENPRFTTVIANRMWRRLMGVGLIEPVDEITDSTVPMVPELMTYLERLMVEKKYNLKSYLRVLLNSEVYQRMPSPKGLEPGETYAFTGPLLRRMTAEQLWDSLATLISGDVDARSILPDERNAAQLDALGRLSDAISEKTPEQLVASVKALQGTEEGAKQQRLDALSAEMKEAQKAGDKERARKLASELAGLRRGSRDIAFVAVLGEEGAEQYEEAMAEARQGAPKKGDGKKGAALNREEMRKMLAEGMTKQEIRAKLQEMRDTARVNGSAVRASELSSPAPRGHFLRTFGQSDRETIENGNTECSVPQALKLLNGPVAPVLMASNSHYQAALEAAPDRRSQEETVYLSLLSRRPTVEERQILDNVFEAHPKTALEDITHAVLNTAEFLFIR